MARTKTELPTRTVLLDDGTLMEAPFDPCCGACRSPWIPEIDQALAAGLTPQAIRSDLKGRRPAVPNSSILLAHVDHLPERTRAMRRLLEDPGRMQVGTRDALGGILAAGWRALAEGRLELTSADWMKALSLKIRQEQSEERYASAQAWQAAFMAFFEIVRNYLPPAEWQAFAAECYASPEILAVSSIAPPAPGGG
jgi:hypothetical protein